MKIYFEDEKTYQNMIQDAIDEDFSWIKENKEQLIEIIFALIAC